MKTAAVIHWKTKHAPGIRCFSDEAYARRRVVRAGGDLADLHKVGDMFVYWPRAFGPLPDAATLRTWELEFDAQPASLSLEQRVQNLEKGVVI